MSSVDSVLAALLSHRGLAAFSHLRKHEGGDDLAAYLVSRTLVAWVRNLDGDVDGVIPGTETRVQLRKNQDGWDGSVQIANVDYSFTAASEAHVASALMTALGVHLPAEPLPSHVLVSIGLTVDKLVKAAKGAASGEGQTGKGKVAEPLKPIPHTPTEDYKETGRGLSPAERVLRPEILNRKKILEGKKPQGQEEESSQNPSLQNTAIASPPKTDKAKAPPTAATPQKASIPKIPQKKGIKITKNEAKRICLICGTPSIVDGKWQGCLCLRGLGKKVTVVSTPDGHYRVTPDDTWDADERATLYQLLGR